MSLQLQNPHSVIAALETRPDDVIDIHVRSRKPSPAWEQAIELAASRRVRVQIDRGPPPSQKRGRGSKSQDPGRSGGSYATVKENSGRSLEDVIGASRGQPANGELYLALDCLQDPHNVGAIFRSAAFFGVKGIVLTKDRSAPMNAAVYDVASGGVEYVPFSLQTNLARTLDVAKDNGLWILGTSEHAESDFAEIKPDRAWLLVLGNEEKGMRRLTQEKCDVVCRLTPRTPVTSLNVSVAAGIFIAQLAGTE